MPQADFIRWIGIHRSRFFEWKKRYGKGNVHNAPTPKEHWLADWEREAICAFARAHPGNGYRRLTFMMLDADVVAVSPSSVYRVLKEASLLSRWPRTASKKGTGFQQPDNPHEHWHIDIAYINIRGTFFYLCTVLDGCSRFIVHHELREAMKEADIERLLQRALEAFPGVQPRIISDNGPQFIARDFKTFVRAVGVSHVQTSPYYPQSNGKIERYHRTLKSEGIRPRTPLSFDDGRDVIAGFVNHYNENRLHSAIGYIPPRDRLQGRHERIFARRDLKLETAREARRQLRAQPQPPPTGPDSF